MVQRTAAIGWLGLFVTSLLACSGGDNNAPGDEGSVEEGGSSAIGSGGAVTGESGGGSNAGGSVSTTGTSAGGASSRGGAGLAGTGGKVGAGGGASGAAGASGGAGKPIMGPDGGSGGQVGVWENVTPASVNLDQAYKGGDNYGVQDVLADPVRPSDLYAFICQQGAWRSTDYGRTWKQTYAGDNWGKPWGTAIDPNPARDPDAAPALYVGVSNAIGFVKSTDFGVTWTVTKMPADFGDYRYQQVYSVDVDPNDTKHLIVAFHEAPDVAESTDAGATWVKHITPPEDGGSSYYPFFINTGNAATTRKTWLTVPQQNGDARALRTTDGGATWTKLNKFQHHHGSAEIFDAGGGTLYVAAMQPDGVHKSTDFGVTWNMLTNMSSGVVTASSKTLYTSVGLGWGNTNAPLNPTLVSAPRTADANWKATTAPTGMVDGAKRIAVTNDGTHNIIVAGNWHAGIWRYVEP
jgi:hypothetical protein